MHGVCAWWFAQVSKALLNPVKSLLKTHEQPGGTQTPTMDASNGQAGVKGRCPGVTACSVQHSSALAPATVVHWPLPQ